MKKMGMPQNTVTNKMKLDGFDKNDIKLFFEGKAAWEKAQKGGGNDELDEETKKKFKKYEKMKKMGMPENTIRNKMRLDGLNKAIQDKFFGIGGSKKRCK
mmetsp:Transcript_10323/g.12827  ORF Transcript_10323/g.12827 Transcript_10323/m.12827 type:complete len:100 (-) Transcript_10323:3-302(-)